MEETAEIRRKGGAFFHCRRCNVLKELLKMSHSRMGKVTAFALSFILVVVNCLITPISAGAESYEQKQIIITKDYQVVDTFYGVPAVYVLGYSDTGDYCCAAYVSKFYAKLFGVTVYNINMVDDKPSVYCYGKTVELRTVTTPKPGDIMQTKEYTHVGIVKACSGDEVTLIEQNYKWTYNGQVNCVVNRKIVKKNYYFYRLYINGVEQSLSGSSGSSNNNTADTTAPVITNAKTSNVTSAGYKVTANITDNKKVSKIVVTTYPVSKGTSAAKLEVFTKADPANFSYNVYTANYGGVSGSYATVIKAYDEAGNVSSQTVKATVPAKQTITLSASSVTVKVGAFKTLTAKLSSGSGTILWKTSNSAVAKVSNGKVTGVAQGTATITAYVSGGASAACSVKVAEDIGKTNISVTNVPYTGKAVTPKVSITYGGKTLANGTDYTISCSDSQVGEASAVIKGKGLFTGSKTVSFQIAPTKPKGLKIAARSSGAIKTSWNSVSSADGYFVSTYDSSAKKWVVLDKIKGTAYTQTKLASCTEHKHKVTAYKVVGSKTYYSASAIVAAYTLPTQTSFTAASKISGTVTLSFKAQQRISGREIYVSDTGVNGSFKKLTNSTASTYTVKNAKKATVKFFKVRAYKIVNGKKIYGAFSKTQMALVF